MPRSEPSPELVTSSSIGMMPGGRYLTSVDCETIKQSCATGALQVLLAAPAGGVRRIPRARVFTLAHAIVMADLRATLAARRPVPAREIVISTERRPVRPRACEDVVHVGPVAHAVHGIGSFGNRVLLVDFAFGAVQLCTVRRDENPDRVVPGTAPDPVARVDGRLSLGGRGAEIGTPGVISRSLGFRESLAMRVGSGQTAKVSALAHAFAGDEKPRHRFGAAHLKGWRS